MNEKHLLKLANDCYNEYYERISQCDFFTVDNDCETRYMSNSKHRWSILLCGPMSEKLRQDNKIFEKRKLRANTKNYDKLFYKNGTLLKIERYVNGRLDHIYLCYYCGNVRILKPFTANGGFYPTYSLITVYSNKKVIKEIWIDGDQIITETYSYNNGSIDYEFANLAPASAKNKILFYSKGSLTDTLRYTETERFSWLETLK